MTTPELVAPQFVAKVETITGIHAALDHEPGAEGLPKRPCVTMLYKGPQVVGQATGNLEDVEHVWDVYVYVDVKRDFRDPQIQFAQLLPELQNAVRDDVTLNGSCEWARLRDPGDPPFLDEDQGHAWKLLELRALKGET